VPRTLRASVLAGCAIASAIGQDLVVESPLLKLTVFAEGTVAAAEFRRDGWRRKNLSAGTALDGFAPAGRAAVRRGAGGSVEVERVLSSPVRGLSCRVRERFSPAANGIRWDTEIESDGRFWSAGVQTRLLWPAPEKALIWTAWGDNRRARDGKWADPLVPVRFFDLHLRYGSATYSDTDPCANCDMPTLFRQVFSLPLISVLDPDGGVGLTLALSPEDTLLDLTLGVDRHGGVSFSRFHHRFGGGRKVKFSADLVSHEPDWRAGLGWLVKRYPAYFRVQNPLAEELIGTAAYSAYEGPLDAARLRGMAFGFNWKASYDFPYMGMYLPPVGDGTWVPYSPRLGLGKEGTRGRMSVRRMAEYSARMRELGFYVLSYFNVNHFGADIVHPAPPRKAVREEDLWKEPNDLLYGLFPGALLLKPDGRPYWSWGNSVATDPGDPAYRDFLLEQARLNVKLIPASSGIAIDRVDWWRFYNRNADDGETWFNDGPARSLLISWRDLSAKLAPILHEGGQVLFINQHVKRLETLLGVDGIFDEHFDQPESLNGTALLGLTRPVVGWTWSAQSLKPDPDAFFQRHLHMGVFPMAPYPENDHSVQPDEWVDAQYLAYGPLLAAMRGRKWVLEADAVRVESGQAKVNLFATKQGLLVPVTFGKGAPTVSVRLRGVPGFDDLPAIRVESLLPGRAAPNLLAYRVEGGRAVAAVPLERGCAMVRISRK
jgi:hypothetical protein